MPHSPTRRLRARYRLVLLPLVVALAASALLGACDEGAQENVATPSGAASVLGDDYPRYADEESGISVILGTPDLAVGTNRVALVLSNPSGLVRLPVVRVASFAPDAGEEPAEEAIARFYEFPLGIRGIYVTELAFDRPGAWSLEVSIPRPAGTIEATRFPVAIDDETLAPNIGDPAPASVSRTVSDVDALEQLSTGAEIDPALYQISIDNALESGLPSMIVFASPGFCTNALCGPQVEVMSELRAKYPDQANYIHVDLFENPVDLRSGGLDSAIRSPLLEEWGLRTDEWTFLVDADGRVTHRFEAFVPIEELEPALTSVLAD